MSADGRTTRRRPSRLDVIRVAYLLVAVGFGVWGVHRHGRALAEALADMSPLAVAFSCALVLLGLLMTLVVWRTLLSGHGHRLDSAPAARVFFVGQLGKYIPGSLWAIGAQADLARDFRVPPRATVATGLVFLWVHLSTAIAVYAMSIGSLLGTVQTSRWIPVVVAFLALTGVSPPVLTRITAVIAGRQRDELAWSWRGSGLIAILMLVVWALYGTATFLALPTAAAPSARGLATVLTSAVGAFAASYVIGVVAVFAPAGVGVREVVLVALLAPLVGVPAAAACALVTRAIHTACDFTLAGVAWVTDRARPVPEWAVAPQQDSD